MVEITSDDGKTWADISTLVAIGYGGAIASEENPLDGREAFVGTNPSYPDRDTETLLLGDQLAGQTVRLRFRVGTDTAAGADGWDIDNIAFTGIDNTPFPRWTADAGACDAVGTSGDETGESSGGGDGSSSGAVPTTGGDGGPQAESSSSETGDTAPETGEDGGCGCASGRPGPLGLAAALLLLGLRRRRRAELR